MQALVVYYSRTGHTKKVGEEIAKELKCDSEELVDTVNRSGPLGWINSGRQASTKALTKLQPLQKDPSKYDIVIIGTPVWAGTMSTPIRTYVAENRDKIRKVAAFITLGGRGQEKTLLDLEAVGGKKPAATLVVTAKDIKAGTYADAVKKFAGEINA